MASVLRSLIISHAPRSGCSGSNNQAAAWTTLVYHKPSHSKFRDISSLSYSNASLVIATTQLASAITAPIAAEIVHEDLDSSAEDMQETATLSSESDDLRFLTLPKRFAHLSELVSQLCSGVDVPSAMDPWLQELSIFDWNQLLIECASKDWKISMQIMDFFKEKEALLHQAVLFPQKKSEVASGSSEKSLHDLSVDSNGRPSEEAVVETPQETTLHGDEGSMDSSTAVRTLQGDEETITSCPPSLDLPGKNDQEEKREMITPALKLYTTLVNLLTRRKLFEEVDRVHSSMKEAGLEPNGHYYNVLLDSYIERCSFAQAFEVLHTMKSAGFEPHHSIYEKLAYTYMNQENPDADTLKALAKDFKIRCLPVSVDMYKKLLKIKWEARDVAGAEDAFEELLAVGYTPEMKAWIF